MASFGHFVHGYEGGDVFGVEVIRVFEDVAVCLEDAELA